MSEQTGQVAVVTGAGSGVGRAVSIRLAQEGWRVALVGRRIALLEETARLCGDASGQTLCCETELADSAAIGRMARRVLDTWGTVHALVNCAGTNIAQRALSVLKEEDWRLVLDVNATAAFLCTSAFLPAMRAQKRGTIVNVISDAGLIASAKAGPAYVASKFALSGLTQSINCEERHNGIRACAIFPGDINTPLLDKRPAPPPKEARVTMLQPEDLAQCVMLCLTLPDRAVVEQLLVRPRT
jgi:NAD(P)-dependent dehydrogenase (short-subunit alcohol dehydrogenase family)